MNVYVFFFILLCILGFGFFIVFVLLQDIIYEKEKEIYADKKNIKDLVKKFHKKLDEARSQHTDEILECLKDLEDVDAIYYVMVDNDYHVMSEEKYIRVKNDILSEIIDSKIKKIQKGKNKKENYKSLYDELMACEKRYPLYKNLFFDKVKKIEKKI